MDARAVLAFLAVFVAIVTTESAEKGKKTRRP